MVYDTILKNNESYKSENLQKKKKKEMSPKLVDITRQNRFKIH